MKIFKFKTYSDTTKFAFTAMKKGWKILIGTIKDIDKKKAGWYVKVYDYK